MGEHYEDIIVNQFTEESALKFRQQIIQKAVIYPDQPITIYIDSYGGYIDSLNSMLEDIEQVPNQIITVCKGKAMSCGAVLLAAGDHRFCGRHSRVMIHQGSSGARGPIESLQNDVTEDKRLNKELLNFIAKRCGMTHSTFKAEMKKRLVKDDDEARDMYLPAEAALELGIVDYIGMPHVKPIIMYQVEPAPEKEYAKMEAPVIPKVPRKKINKKKVAKKKAAKRR